MCVGVGRVDGGQPGGERRAISGPEAAVPLRPSAPQPRAPAKFRASDLQESEHCQ